MSPKILRFAVILAGCGNKDGAEIHESVLTLLSIDRAGHQYQCFAPDVPQGRVLNFLTNEEMKEKRNVLLESARIARSKIKPLSDFRQEDFDILVMPGGNGVAYNLCTFAVDGDRMSVLAEVEGAVRAMHAAGKPIGALCISPVIIAKVLKKVKVTFGRDEKIGAMFQKSGTSPVNADARSIVIDQDNKIVTTPCYMLDARISEISEGIDKLIHQLVKMGRLRPKFMRILVIEDEIKIAQFIKRGLKEEGYAVDVAHDGEEGHFLMSSNEYDAIILDLMLPKIDGLTLCRTLRKEGNQTPIIMLTAKDTVKDKVKGLDSGADDYLPKPFAFEELLARVRVLLRKKDSRVQTQFKVEDLSLDLLTHKVTRGDREIDLTVKEYALLEYLMRNAGNIVTRTMISEHVWDINFDTFTNVIDVYINYLRNKVDSGFENKMIHTVRGKGYLLKK